MRSQPREGCGTSPPGLGQEGVLGLRTANTSWRVLGVPGQPWPQEANSGATSELLVLSSGSSTLLRGDGRVPGKVAPRWDGVCGCCCSLACEVSALVWQHDKHVGNFFPTCL